MYKINLLSRAKEAGSIIFPREAVLPCWQVRHITILLVADVVSIARNLVG